MERRRIELEPAYLLHARPYSDTSLLIEIFTANRGRQGLIARGARAPKSRQRALLQVLQPLLISWRESGELGTLVAVEASGQPIPLAGEDLFCAWYANELLLKLLPRGDAHPLLFAAYSRLLLSLPTGVEPALRDFERCLLDELGYGLSFPTIIAPDQHYGFTPGIGLQAVGPGEEGFLGASLLALRDGALVEPQHLADVRRLMRAALAPLLAGREIQTATLLRELRRL